MNGFGMTAYKSMGAIMLATTNDEVQTIKQGYLLKRSSSLRADWKRRFFILDSQGTLYYYRNKGPKVGGSPSLHSSHSLEHNNRVFSRFRTRHHREALPYEERLGCSTVDLRTSTIKIDAEDTDLRLCFRIISPLKAYTLQAETEADRMDWMNKITGVIASLLNSHLQQVDLGKHGNDKIYDPSGASFSRPLDNGEIPYGIGVNGADSVSRILREVSGNDQCAECSASDPDWASLNLGILMCIECSGIHRNLGVHISKVRSVTLDVKVWEPTVLNLFQALGNAYCNSVWEELLSLHNDQKIEAEAPSVTKPSPSDTIHQKEKYIEAKYVRKLLVNKEATASKYLSASTIWEAVRANNLREVYRICITSDANRVNTTYDDMVECNFYHHEMGSQRSFHDSEKEQLDRVTCEGIKSSNDPGDCLHGCSLLHLACHNGSLVMLELLLQLGADINKRDLHGRTPLQHCILKGNNQMAKFLLRR
ncbi:UNVERIFIED_CONTAM: ADP-ribosylation factor GTPase-activating protein AGD2 [Sesamum angustifolium]|uniref:ADP-ribosylation factor GTPase-activating protein AGD2 n=1 Tax=Sesamum angustifolium TaxID=2727405 RepID=A0AAW2KKU7_9LAMI